LVRFLGRQNGDLAAVARYDSRAHGWNGKRTAVRLLPPIDRPLRTYEGQEWYVFGLPDAAGAFVVQSMAPRDVLRAGENGIAWRAGDRALLVQIAGGLFGHFAYGTAELVEDATTGELRFEKTYYHLYAHNGEGLIAGATDWSRAMGDRQAGCANARSVSEIVVKDERLTGSYGSIALQLGAMAARYRIGDGTGGTYAGIAHNSTQDSNRAFVKAVPRLRKRLEPLGALYSTWSQNDFSLGSTFEDAPLRNFAVALSNWPCIVPHLAREAIVRALARDGADVTSMKFGSASFRLGPPEPTEQYRLD
jgi:predicted Abi (CAAX) family protease